jgi:hypothetical protein
MVTDTAIAIHIIIKIRYNIHMSLGDLNRNVNIAGQQTYNNAAGRMLREKEMREKQMKARENDLLKHEISHRRLEHQRVLGQVQNLKRELVKLKSGRRDPHILDLIRRTESELRTLEGESRVIESDIRSKTLDIQRHGGMSF